MSKKKFLLAIVLTLKFSCSDDLQNIPVNELHVSPDPLPKPAALVESSQMQLDRLNEIAPDGSESDSLIKDVKLLLEAQSLSDQSLLAESAKKYFEALKITEDRFADFAFKHWIKTYAKSLEQKVTPIFLARLLNDISQNGATSPYLQKRGYTSAEKLVPQVILHASSYLSPDSLPTTEFPDAPKNPGIPTHDPLLTQTMKKYCEAKGSHTYQWEAWIKTLESQIQLYWDNFILTCKGDAKKGFSNMENTYRYLADNPATVNLALHSMRSMTKFFRQNAAREKASQLYIQLLKIWEKDGLTPANMSMNAQEFQLEKINDYLWASRYRVLIGDYENGKIFANQAIKYVDIAHTIAEIQSSELKKKLASYKAEAYLILGNQIGLEQKDINSSISFMLLAQQIPDLDNEMRDRVIWYTGLYYYLDKKWEHAIKHLEKLISITTDENVKAQGYFWIARSYMNLNNREKSARYVLLLTTQYPQNFYSVVALTQSELSQKELWTSQFGNESDMTTALKNRKDFGLSFLKDNPSLYRKLKRAELLILGNIQFWDKEAVLDLDKPMQTFLKKHPTPGPLVYLSRLQYSVGNYLDSIILTSKLITQYPSFWKDWPEQLLIYYPRPFDDIYSRNALEKGVDKNLLLAISRQESAFNPSAQSGAGAFGLMQLITPTAHAMAKNVGIKLDNVSKDLTNPETNVLLGTQYLKTLNLHYPQFRPAVYGAYNAGEYAVDIWLERRGHIDPLIWIELVPFGETRGYIKNVWRNIEIYNYIEREVIVSALDPKTFNSRENIMNTIREQSLRY